MRFVRGTLGAIALATALAACGGGDKAEVKDPQGEPVTPVESAECRQDFTVVDGIIDALGGQATDDVDGIQQLNLKVATVANRVSMDCSSTVSDLTDKADQAMAQVQARAQGCQFMSLCDDRPIAKGLVSTADFLGKAKDASERTE